MQNLNFSNNFYPKVIISVIVKVKIIENYRILESLVLVTLMPQFAVVNKGYESWHVSQ